MKKEKLKSIVLSRTVVFEGRHYPPESVQEWPVSIADELVDKGAAEPLADVVIKGPDAGGDGDPGGSKDGGKDPGKDGDPDPGGDR